MNYYTESHLMKGQIQISLRVFNINILPIENVSLGVGLNSGPVSLQNKCS